MFGAQGAHHGVFYFGLCTAHCTGDETYFHIAVQCPLHASNKRQYMHIPLKGGDLFYKIPCAYCA